MPAVIPRGRTTAIVYIVAAAALAVFGAVGSFAEGGASVPSGEPGQKFSDAEVLGAVGITVALMLTASWLFQRFGPTRYRAVAIGVLLLGPVVWAVVVVDALTVRLLEQVQGGVGVAIALTLVVGLPLFLAASVLAILAEYLRRGMRTERTEQADAE